VSGSEEIAVAVVTGHHPYDVQAFQDVFRCIPDVQAYPQSLEEYGADTGRARERYDVVVFYHFHQETPADEQPWWAKGTREALEALGQRPQGILVLHHALLAFPDWGRWSDLCGIPDRRFGYHPAQTLHVDVADAEHPITRGLAGWEMVDETYTMQDAAEDSHILLTTRHPRSMATLAWTRHYGQARVFCLQSGHDNQTFAHPQFRTVVAQGLRWLVGRL
jgi:type 1 glutamine amidotransferase